MDKEGYFPPLRVVSSHRPSFDGSLYLTYENEQRVLAANDPGGVAFLLEGLAMSAGFTDDDVEAVLELDAENVAMSLLHDLAYKQSFAGAEAVTFSPVELLSAYRSGDDLAELTYYPEGIQFTDPQRRLTAEQRDQMFATYEASITPAWIEGMTDRNPIRALLRASGRMTDDQFRRAAEKEPRLAQLLDPNRLQSLSASPDDHTLETTDTHRRTVHITPNRATASEGFAQESA